MPYRWLSIGIKKKVLSWSCTSDVALLPCASSSRGGKIPRPTRTRVSAASLCTDRPESTTCKAGHAEATDDSRTAITPHASQATQMQEAQKRMSPQACRLSASSRAPMYQASQRSVGHVKHSQASGKEVCRACLWYPVPGRRKLHSRVCHFQLTPPFGRESVGRLLDPQGFQPRREFLALSLPPSHYRGTASGHFVFLPCS